MSLNLITDPWIPVRCKDGGRAVIAPYQMADPALAFPDWPRPDLNIACLELLAGLLFMADPPRDADDWDARQTPDPERLRNRLAPYAPAFELLGEGPRFLQDREAFEVGVRDPNPAEMLLIDSAGGQTLRNNADLMVKRDRYPALPLPVAAMALYALQAHAPSGGKGNRTSMRGGGPLVTLVDPGGGLWPLIWANVPDGMPAPPEALPWMRPARTSESGQIVTPEDAHPSEAFFGQPRRLRLVAEGDAVTGVVQKPYGANYAQWLHPLTPYYRLKPGSELLPRHPRAGVFGYRNWMGIVLQRPTAEDDTARRAQVLELWGNDRQAPAAEVIVAGWAMDNMKPRDFIFSRAPLLNLTDAQAERVEGLVTAAENLAVALRGALAPLLAEGEAREAAREGFFRATQAGFEARLARLHHDAEAEARGWLGELKKVAIAQFDAMALPGLSDRDTRDQQSIISARRNLGAAFAGYGKLGRAAFTALDLTPPVPKRKEKVA